MTGLTVAGKVVVTGVVVETAPRSGPKIKIFDKYTEMNQNRVL